MNWSEHNVIETARALIKSRQKGKPRETYAGEDVPPTIPLAYAVQSKAIELWPDKLAGFKVGGIAPQFKDQYPADWIAGPVFSKNVYSIKPSNTLDFPVYQDGFAAFEPELIFEIDAGASEGRSGWRADSAKGVIRSVYIGAEIAASPNVNVNALGPGSIISDFGNNAGIIIGPEVKLKDLNKVLSVMTETRIDGTTINRCKPAASPSGPLGALAFLLNHLGAHSELYELPKSLYVSSGAITGVHDSHVGAVGELDYDGFDCLSVRLVGGAGQ